MSQIKLFKNQALIFKSSFVDKNKYTVVAATRGFGKSYLASVCAVAAARELINMPNIKRNKNVFIIAPTYSQVTEIYWPYLMYELGLEQYAVKAQESRGKIFLPNNTCISLVSYKAANRMRGKGAYYVIWDEVSSCLNASNTWKQVIQPCIITRWPDKGRALFISTPNGYDFFYDLYREYKSFMFNYKDSPYLNEEEILALKSTMTEYEFRSEYEATFETSGLRVFDQFSIDESVIDDKFELEEHERVYATIDFNIGLQCTALFVIRDDCVYFFDEFYGNHNTDELAKALKSKYIDKGHKLTAFPDPSGKARKTSAAVGDTDFSILESYGINVLARKKSPTLKDSATATNRMIKTADGSRRLFVFKECKRLIDSLLKTTWVPNSDKALIDKSQGVEHYSDGVRYGMDYLFPIRRPVTVAQGSTF